MPVESQLPSHSHTGKEKECNAHASDCCQHQLTAKATSPNTLDAKSARTNVLKNTARRLKNMKK